VAVVGNRSAAQSVVVGLTTELNWTVLAELLKGSHLKTTQNMIYNYFYNTMKIS